MEAFGNQALLGTWTHKKPCKGNRKAAEFYAKQATSRYFVPVIPI